MVAHKLQLDRQALLRRINAVIQQEPKALAMSTIQEKLQEHFSADGITVSSCQKRYGSQILVTLMLPDSDDPVALTVY